jgi:hypothetical protein
MKPELQLVGVTAMLLASKVEEIYTPEIGDFVYITDNAYSRAQIKACETKMAATLMFNFGDPLCIHFLRRNSKAARVNRFLGIQDLTSSFLENQVFAENNYEVGGTVVNLF